MIQLQRTVRVRTFEVEATIAVARNRPEFLAVARLAADLGPIGGRDVSRELLGNLPVQVGWRVIDRALAMGLLERGDHKGPASLSEHGRQLLDEGVVLVPEEGVWRLYLIRDPLFSAPLVQAVRLESLEAKKERSALYDRSEDPRGNDERTPPVFVNARGELLGGLAGGAAFKVLEIGDRGEAGPEGRLRLQLRWQPGQDARVHVTGRLPAGDRDKALDVDTYLPTVRALAELEYEDLWASLAAEADGVSEDVLFSWMERAGAPVLPTTMDPWAGGVRRTFQADLVVPRLHLDGLGEFDASKLHAVPLVASSQDAAQAWAEWLQWDGIDRYVAPADLAAIGEEVLGRFPLHRPQLPTPPELLAKAKAAPRDRTSRFILTPADLGLWR